MDETKILAAAQLRGLPSSIHQLALDAQMPLEKAVAGVGALIQRRELELITMGDEAWHRWGGCVRMTERSDMPWPPKRPYRHGQRSK